MYQFGVPGTQAIQSTVDAEILWGGDASRIPVLRESSLISSAASDAGATPTTTLRKGLLLGKITSSSKLVQWDSAATDGSQEIDSVLGVELQMTDRFGTAIDRYAPTIVSAPLKASSLLIKGSALVGHADEYLARRSLAAAGCVLDDDPQQVLCGRRKRYITKAADFTVLATENGATYLIGTANATATLPAIKPGLEFDFLRTSDHNTVVTSAEGDNIIVGNDASADSITFSTASQKIGAGVRVKSVYVGATLKWLSEIIPVPFSTGAQLTIALAT